MPLRYPPLALAALLLGLAPAAAQTTLTASLSGANEVPPVDTEATGSVSALLFEGTTADTVVVGGTFSGLESDFATNIGAHLHGGAADENGPVRYVLTPTLGDDNRSGTFRAADNRIPVRKTFADSLRNGLVYVNVHTVGNTSGEIRGQLRVSTPIGVGDVVINEFLADPANDAPGDANGDGTRNSSDDEFIEFVNTTDGPVDLSGFVIEDVASSANADPAFIRHIFPAGTVVPAGGAVVVFGGGDPMGTFGGAVVQTASNPTTTFSPQIGLNNDGDSITLATSPITGGVGAGTTITSYEYTAGIDDQAFARNPDETGNFVAHTSIRSDVRFSPGVLNVSGDPFVMAMVQVIHNAPDPDAATVDVYVNGTRLLNDLDFREASPFVGLTPGMATTIDVTAGSATDNSSPVFSVTLDDGLPAGAVAQVIALGVLDDTPADDSDDEADEFFLLLDTDARTMAMAANMVAVRAVHGSPDAPAVDVRTGGTVLFDNLEYPGISGYVEVAPMTYVLDVTAADAATGATPVASFSADLSAAGGRAVTVLASGLLDPSDDGAGAPSFGLLAVFADGTTALLPRATSNEDGAGADGLAITVVNPLRGAAAVAFETGAAGTARLEAFDLLGRRVALLADGPVSGAEQTATLDAGALAPGVYVLRLTTEAGTLARTVTVVR